MIGLIFAGLLVIVYLLLEHGCADRSASRQLHWFELIQSGALTISKKARTRGEINTHGLTRRQQHRKDTP